MNNPKSLLRYAGLLFLKPAIQVHLALPIVVILSFKLIPHLA